MQLNHCTAANLIMLNMVPAILNADFFFSLPCLDKQTFITLYSLTVTPHPLNSHPKDVTLGM